MTRWISADRWAAAWGAQNGIRRCGEDLDMAILGERCPVVQGVKPTGFSVLSLHFGGPSGPSDLSRSRVVS